MLSQSFLNNTLAIVNQIFKKTKNNVQAEGTPVLKKFEFEF